jgi:hypothetical protein
MADAEEQDGDVARLALHDYAYSASVPHPCVNGCIEVDAIPLGFALLSRKMLGEMVRAYASGEGVLGGSQPLAFADVVDEVASPTVAIFQLMIRNGSLFGEDYSFCQRWRDIGGKVQLWAGPDCELTHIGAHAYASDRRGYVKG